MLETNDSTAKPRLTREGLREATKMFAFVKPYRWQFLLGLILLALSSLVFMIFPYTMGVMLDVALRDYLSAEDKTRLGGVLFNRSSGQTDVTLPQMAVFLGIVLAAQGVVSYWRVVMFAQVSERATADIRKAIYQRIVQLPIVFFEKTRVGELVSRLTNDVEKLYNTFSFVLAEFLRQIILLVGGIIYLAIQTPRLAGIMLATFPLIMIGAMVFGRYIRKLSKERQAILADSNVILDETLQSIYAVKAFTNEGFEYGRYSRKNGEVVGVSLKFASARAIFAVFIITVLFGGLFFVVGMGMLMVQSGRITPGELISFVVFTAVIGGAIAGLGNFYSEIVGAVGATERVREILDSATEREQRPQATRAAGRLKGNVELEEVQFSYPTRPDVPVLKGVSLSIPAGSKVALVGQSGAGKSTIMQLLLQFHYPASGQVRVDGIDINEYELESYRQNFAIVPQEVILFGGTIRENILYGKPDATDAEIESAARQANTWDFISSFPEGLQTIVGERGVKLSGGQRQRIAIARAILRNPSILLLDEATSSLDAESEKVVQDALNNLMEGRTSIIIAHRLATIRDVDCIYVIEGGRIVEQGTHDALSLIDDGAYSSLAKLQFDGIAQ